MKKTWNKLEKNLNIWPNDLVIDSKEELNMRVKILNIGMIKNFMVLSDLSGALYMYILWFFFSMFLSSYNTYFYKKYPERYQWIYPMIGAICFIFTLWILTQVAFAVEDTLQISFIIDLAKNIQTYYIIIFIAVLLISYGAMLLNLENNSKKK
jgi:hypothetical protein